MPTSPEPDEKQPQPSAANVADIFSDSPYLSSESSYNPEGTSAADRFRKSLSSVSHGVIQSVRDIPRSVWRITLLVIASLVLLALLIWGCIKLYEATSIAPVQQPPASQDLNAPQDLNEPNDFKSLKNAKGSKDPKGTKGSKPVAKSQPKADKRPTPSIPQTARKTADKPASSKPAKRPPLRSTGQKVPPLYAD